MLHQESCLKGIMVNVREIPGDVMVEELTTEFSSMEKFPAAWTNSPKSRGDSNEQKQGTGKEN